MPEIERLHNEERDIAADFDADFAANEKVVNFCCKRKGCEQQGRPFETNLKANFEQHNKTAKHLRSAGEISGDGETSGDAGSLVECTGARFSCKFKGCQKNGRDYETDLKADYEAHEKSAKHLRSAGETSGDAGSLECTGARFSCNFKGCQKKGRDFETDLETNYEAHKKSAKHLRSAGETSGDAVLLICTGPVGGSGCPKNFSTQFSSTFKRYVLLLEYTQ